AEARYAAGERSASLFRFAERAAPHLDTFGTDEALRAHLLAGRLALSQGRVIEADQHLDRAARSRRRRPPLTRSLAWLARALQAEAHRSSRGTLAACARGLGALQEHQLTLGATELRAYGTAHGAELAMLAQREAFRRGDGRRLLFGSEGGRAPTLAAGGTPLRHDRELAAELSALRHVTRLLARSEMPAPGRSGLERERRRLEAAVQARTRRAPGSGVREAAKFDLGALCAELGDRTLIELVEVDNMLHVISIAGRRVRPYTPCRGPQREGGLSRLRRRRIGRGRLRAGDEALLAHMGADLEASLLGPAAAELGDRPVVVVPPGRLHAVPWTLMPSLRDRAVTVAPSASAWLRGRRTRPPAHRRGAPVAGPPPATGGAGGEQLPAHYPRAGILGWGRPAPQRGGTPPRSPRLPPTPPPP